MATIIQSINGGDPVLEPTMCEISQSDLYSDQSGRSAESGDMLLYLIKKGVYTIELEFVGTAAQIRHIDSLIVGGDFTVVFFDETNTEDSTPWSPYVSRKMYASDRKKVPLGTPSGRKYRLSFNLIETRRGS
ncbi:MAG: hypothetical protein Q4A05_04795 [Ruminococcus sp.]|nr:hypothetical protein [Ruminococcus sp.]